MRAHADHIAMKYSFLEVLTANLSHTPDHTPNHTEQARLKQLRQHCLEPGRYHKHISRWLHLFPPQQLLLVDGELLDVQPSQVLAAVQKFLKLPFVQFGNTLR